MRDVKNNVEVSKVQPKQEIKAAKLEEVTPVVAAKEEKVISDSSNPSAEILGRSQVSPADALQKDVAFGMAHPEAINQADKFFDMAYAQSGDYAKASELTAAFVGEFASK